MCFSLINKLNYQLLETMAALTKGTNNSQPPKLLEPTRILHLYKSSLSGSTALILDSDKQTVLYEIDVRCFGSPTITLYRGSTQGNIQRALVGTANFRSFTTATDLQIGNSSVITLHTKSSFTRSKTFDSILGPLKWQYDGPFSRNLSLVNSQEEWFARFQYVAAVSKWGRFEIAPGVTEGAERLLDEIVLSGIAILVRVRRNNR